ncbi:MAG: DUF2666 family protein [Candidatus Micrarchaeaceae archaeon]
MDEEEINFFAKYKDWVAIHKLSIREDTKPEYIAGYLVLIKDSISRKAYEILGIDTKKLDEIAERIAKGKRKSYESLLEALKSINTKEIKEEVEGAFASKGSIEEKDLHEIAYSYLRKKISSLLGYKFDIDQELFESYLPDIKLFRSRFGRRKKEASEGK